MSDTASPVNDSNSEPTSLLDLLLDVAEKVRREDGDWEEGDTFGHVVLSLDPKPIVKKKGKKRKSREKEK